MIYPILPELFEGLRVLGSTVCLVFQRLGLTVVFVSASWSPTYVEGPALGRLVMKERSRQLLQLHAACWV